jgi:hypothetical protein
MPMLSCASVLLGIINRLCLMYSTFFTILPNPALLDKPAVAHGIFALPDIHTLQPPAYSLFCPGIEEIQVIFARYRHDGIAH